MGAGATLRTRLHEKACIRMSGKDHGTGTISDSISRICCNIVEELVDSYGGVLSGMCLLGADGTECGKEFVIHRAGIIEESTDNTLDSLDTFVVEGGGSVLVREKLVSSAINDFLVSVR